MQLHFFQRVFIVFHGRGEIARYPQKLHVFGKLLELRVTDTINTSQPLNNIQLQVWRMSECCILTVCANLASIVFLYARMPQCMSKSTKYIRLYVHQVGLNPWLSNWCHFYLYFQKLLNFRLIKSAQVKI